MARNDNDELSVMGFEAESAPALADKIQKEMIDPFIGTHHVNIAERYFWQPQYEGGLHSAMIFYVLSEKPAEVEPVAAEAAPAKKAKK